MNKKQEKEYLDFAEGYQEGFKDGWKLCIGNLKVRRKLK